MLALAAKNSQLHMPVIFPGFSWANLKKDNAPNKIPRNCGRFLWRQAYNARMAEQGFWLTLDADGEK